MAKAKDYKELRVWQKGIEIADKTYTITDGFPKSELYSLSGQMRKACVSIPSNIAEGFARFHSREYKQFLYIALGSCAELDTQFVIAGRRGYLTKEKLEEIAETLNHESRMLTSLINKLYEKQETRDG